MNHRMEWLSRQSGSVCQSHSLRRLLLQFKQLILHLEKLHSMFFLFMVVSATKVVDQSQWEYHGGIIQCGPGASRRGYVP